MYKLLPSDISEVINTRLNLDKLYELRLRNFRPVLINYGGEFYYLNKSGISKSITDAIVASGETAQNVVLKASEHSLYAVNENICEGFLTVKGGIRIGIAGEAVKNGKEIKTVKNFYSVNIRVPHEINGCSLSALNSIAGQTIFNTLIISSPGAGKTTFLRDISRTLSNRRINVLLVDERMELASSVMGKPMLDVGACTDIMSGFTKDYAFSKGIRSMRPDVIITDELMGLTDYSAVQNAIMCGVKVIASIHAYDTFDLMSKPDFKFLMQNSIFDRYIVLSLHPKPGTVSGVYDKELKLCN